MTIYINGVAQAPALRKLVSPIPTPSPEWEGITMTHRDEGKTDVLLCIKNSIGTYEWIKISEST